MFDERKIRETNPKLFISKGVISPASSNRGNRTSGEPTYDMLKWLNNVLVDNGLLNADPCCADFEAFMVAGEPTATALGNAANTGQLLTATATLTATQIVGTNAGDLGHADGAVIVAAPGAGYVMEFISAVLIYDYSTAAYTGGGNDLVFQSSSGAVALSGATTAANLLGAAGDKIVQVNPLSTAGIVKTANTGINLKSTAWTQPGTAAGVLRVHVQYRIHTTNL